MTSNGSKRVVALIQARMGSSRLPGKVLEEISGRTVLEWCVDAARNSSRVDAVCVATSQEARDDAVFDWCRANGVELYRGSESDVLARVHDAARALSADVVVRLTGDCPMLDPAVIDQVIWLQELTGADYASNTHPSTWPDGLDVEVFTFDALSRAHAEARLPSEREHVTRWMRANASRLRTETLVCPLPGLHRRRWTLDEPEDLARLRAIAACLPSSPRPGYLDIAGAEDALSEGVSTPGGSEAIAQRNAQLPAALMADLEVRAWAPGNYARSNAALADVEARVPLASQTFSKSRVVLPVGEAPLFISHGLGCRVWDIDGNEYVDLVSALLAVSLGYCDADVDEAVRRQTTRGISFSLATELEFRLAEELADIVPCAQSVRFGKNGTDATSAAVRVARAHTGRDEVVVTGYHGWQDWYIGTTTRNKGVPAQSYAGTHRVAGDDLGKVEELLAARGDRIACVMIEPVFPDRDQGRAHLSELRALTQRHGVLLVFDETVTGFRLALGGAQEYYGVNPDLAAFGKGMANGYPLSCLVGAADIMGEMREVFLSSTFGGEAASLTAALATIAKMRREPVIESIWATGAKLRARVDAIVAENGLADVISLKGVDPWVGVSVHDHDRATAMEIRTFLMKEMMRLGVLVTGSHNISYAHDDAIVELVSRCYARVVPALAGHLERGDLGDSFTCEVVRPVFQIRAG